MLAVLPEIENDFGARRIEAQPYALIYDRVQLLTGGSLDQNPGHLVPGDQRMSSDIGSGDNSP